MKCAQQGFTLIEVIVTVVVSAIALAAIVPLLGTVFMRSHEPIEQLRIGAELHSAMENLIALQAPGTGLSVDALHNTLGAEGSPHAGSLTVVHNHYVNFTGGIETSAPVTNNLLKVTLGNELGERLSRLFAEVAP